MIRARSTLLIALLPVVAAVIAARTLGAQRQLVRSYDATAYIRLRHATLAGVVVHWGKWLTAASAAGFIAVASQEHQKSRRAWNALLATCRSAQDACEIGPGGRYVRTDAEALYQVSRAFDQRANHWLLGAQASLVATAVFFLLDRHPESGPGNIPYSGLRVSVEPTAEGARAGLELRF